MLNMSWFTRFRGKKGLDNPATGKASSNEDAPEIQDIEADAAEGDTFDYIRALVQKVPDDAGTERLSALVEGKRREFDKAYDDCRCKENGQQGYGVIHGFVKMIRSALSENDEESIKVADFLINFCFEMQMMLQSFGVPGSSFEQRIKERLKSLSLIISMHL